MAEDRLVFLARRAAQIRARGEALSRVTAALERASEEREGALRRNDQAQRELARVDALIARATADQALAAQALEDAIAMDQEPPPPDPDPPGEGGAGRDT